MAGIAPGRIVTEEDDIPPDHQFPRASEQTALRLASKGVSASVLRLAQVHDAKKQGLITGLVELARSKGISAYAEEGLNRWPAVQVSDVARLFRLVLEAPQPGAKYHAVGEEGIEMRAIAEAIGRSLAVPVKTLGAEQAKSHFRPLGMFVGQDMPATAKLTMNKLGWRPTGPALLADKTG